MPVWGGEVCACVGRGVCACGEGRCVPVWGGGGVCLCGEGRCVPVWGGGDAIVQKALHQFVSSSCYRPEEDSFGVFGLTYSYDGMELMAS